jgi:hypothetical protein
MEFIRRLIMCVESSPDQMDANFDRNHWGLGDRYTASRLCKKIMGLLTPNASAYFLPFDALA